MAVDAKKLSHTSEFEALCADAATRVTEINIDELEAMLSAGGFYLIDVRDADEFANYRIEGAQHMSKGWIEAKIHTLVEDKDAKIVLYCGGGNRSVLAGDNLQKMGYTNVISVAGGIKAWVNVGKPVIEGA